MGVYTCLYCKKSFNNDTEFSIHRNTHRDINLKCEHCETVLDTKKEASVHYLNKHGLKFFKCEFNFCHLNYEHSDIRSYRMHMLTTRHTDHRTTEIRHNIKEKKVANFLKNIYGKDFFTLDKPIYTEDCDCSHKRRMDIFRILDNGNVLNIEVDEHQHDTKHYRETDASRKNDIVSNFTTKYVWIRYNPDEYKINGIKQKTSFKKRMNVLVDEINRQISRINRCENDKLLEEIRLFYDV